VNRKWIQRDIVSLKHEYPVSFIAFYNNVLKFVENILGPERQ